MDNLLAWFVAIATAIFPQLGEPPEPLYAGYAEAEFVYVAPTLTRQITGMRVAEGETVAQDQLLFEMDATREAASLKAALAREAAAAANLHNLETGSREAEVNVVRASLEQALAEQSLAIKSCAQPEPVRERDRHHRPGRCRPHRAGKRQCQGGAAARPVGSGRTSGAGRAARSRTGDT